ncbi:VasL domain-containing protein [Pluralibacter gergoviae]|uniref:VasL domain-containing protein n=1 Tax=Pluralibacter gergoviae TaxID=61647 RepID=UPI00155EF51B|nr:VasL domain-containing protein [Pluralibacter gergoviae]
MTLPQQLKTGGDPRLQPDYTALREELAKLSHPARPDVDWERVTRLCLALFDRNGVELQTAAWYTLARTRQAGLGGLNEGLALLAVLIVRQWGALWPQPVHARMEILSGLSQRLQAALRTLTPGYADLPQVYEAERQLAAILDALARLELKNASRLAPLVEFMHNASVRLEKMEGDGEAAPAVVLSATPQLAPPETAAPRIYVVQDARGDIAETGQEAQAAAADEPATAAPAASRRAVRLFLAGMLTMLVAGGAALWGWQKLHPAAAPLPVAASPAALDALARQSPLWLQNYGFTLAAGAPAQEAGKLKAQWRQHISAGALPEEALAGWQQGMAGLQDLTRRLNALDERKGKYLTGSELKSMVFAITQDFERSVPVEARLYQLNQTPAGEALPAAQVAQTDLYLNQLLNRYALIRLRTEAQ